MSSSIVRLKSMNNTITLNDDNVMPIIGLGTWKLKDSDAYDSVTNALKIGYRHIDTAAVYGNEEEVGKAIADSEVDRNDIFVTTKLWNEDHDDVEAALDASLDKLGLQYVDLYLIHWPVPERVASYKVFERLKESGKIKSIGVSNFTVRHLEELLEKTDIVPAVNQVEYNPFLNQSDLHEYCISKGIQLEAYSPLGQTNHLSDEKVEELAKKYDVTSAQLMLRWAVQHDIVAIPRSSSQEHIENNFDIFDFEISAEDMEEMNTWNENDRIVGDPESMP